MRMFKMVALVAICVLLSCGGVSAKRHHNSSGKKARTEYASIARYQSTSKLDATDIDLPIQKGVSSQVLKRRGYVVSYNKDTRNPNWVAWRLYAEHSDGPLDRLQKFSADNSVGEKVRVGAEDYKGCGKKGLSRGHMCPAGDNKWDSQAMYDSFLFTNVCPQNSKLNSGAWNSIESDCRRYARKFGDVYIVCGPLYYKKSAHETIGPHKVAVPEAFFKVILCLGKNPKAIGYVVKNNEGMKKKDLYVNTLRQMERITGMRFFPNLDKNIRKAIEDKADINEWR